MRRFISTAGGVLALLGVVWIWGTCRYAAGKDDAKLELRNDAHERVIDSLRIRFVVSESTVARLKDENAHLLVRLRESTKRRMRADTAVDSARARGDTAALVRSLETVNAALVEENRALAEQVSLWQAMYAARDSAATLLHQALDESEALRVAWRKQARPGLLTQARRALPWALAAVVVWEAVR